MSTEETISPVKKLSLAERYAKAETVFDKITAVIHGWKISLFLFLAWTLVVAWASVKVFG